MNGLVRLILSQYTHGGYVSCLARGWPILNLFASGVASMISDLVLWLLSALLHRHMYYLPSSSSQNLFSSSPDPTLRRSKSNMIERKKYTHKRFSDQGSICILQLQPGALGDNTNITLIEAAKIRRPFENLWEYINTGTFLRQLFAVCTLQHRKYFNDG